jgi:hypothetical protein
MHTIVEPTRAGIYVPLSNRERIALYRARIDETSEFHRDRALAGLALRATWGMAPFPAASSTDARRPAFNSCVCATRQPIPRHGDGRPHAADDAEKEYE